MLRLEGKLWTGGEENVNMVPVLAWVGGCQAGDMWPVSPGCQRAQQGLWYSDRFSSESGTTFKQNGWKIQGQSWVLLVMKKRGHAHTSIGFLIS